MEIPGNFKYILIWYSECSPPVRSSFRLPSSFCFWGNWVLEMVIKLCCNFQCCILVMRPKNLTIPIRQLSLYFRVLLLCRGFTFFLKCCHCFQDCTSYYTKWFSGFCYISACHTSTNNFTSFKEFWLISPDNICNKTTNLAK